ncbi:hypothetical protein GW915_13970 [bacterium]|nr:hypothetical protein [bacterium]
MKPEIWKTIEIGTNANTGSALIKELHLDGHRISHDAWPVLQPKYSVVYRGSNERFSVSGLRRTINLVKVSVTFFNFHINAVLERAKEFEAMPAPPESAAQFILQHGDSASQEYLMFPFSSVSNSGDGIFIEAGVFTVTNQGGASKLGFIERAYHFEKWYVELFQKFKVHLVFRLR